jgi:hypothetical protein
MPTAKRKLRKSEKQSVSTKTRQAHSAQAETGLTQAERDLGPCLCCGSVKLGRWQIAYMHENPIGALCFECYGLSHAEPFRLRKMIQFKRRYPDFGFAPL